VGTRIITWPALILCSLVLSCATTGEKAPEPMTPKIIDGRTEPTITKPEPIVKSEAERQAQIDKVKQAHADFLKKLPPPSLDCPYAPARSIKIDGVLNEKAWKKAPAARAFRLTRELTPAKLDTQAKLLWNSRYLYIAFACPDTDVIATLTKRDDDFWKEDVVEVFIDANSDGVSYVELEVSPRNLLYDASIADYRPEFLWSDDLTHLDIYYGIKIFDAPDIQSAVHIDGTLNDSTDADRGWSCEIAVPWKDIQRGTNVNRVPPQRGDVWRIGLYRININTDKANNPDEYAAWNPTTSWFHVPWAFGRVKFVR